MGDVLEESKSLSLDDKIKTVFCLLGSEFCSLTEDMLEERRVTDISEKSGVLELIRKLSDDILRNGEEK